MSRTLAQADTSTAVGESATPWLGLLGIGGGIVAAAIAVFGSDYAWTAATLLLLGTVLAQSWNIAAGFAGQFSLGHTMFFAVGGYTSTVLLSRYGVSPWIGMFVGAALAATVGALLSALAFRRGVVGVFFAVITLSAAEVVRSLIDEVEFLGGSAGIFLVLADQPQNMLFMSRRAYYLIALAMVVLLALGTWWLSRSRYGQYLKALREDEAAAEASGVPTFRCKVSVIALSAVPTALAGTFYAQFLLFISPGTMFSFELILGMLLGTMVGGAGTVAGPIIGALLFGLLSELIRALPFADSREITSVLRICYAIILMVLIIRVPGGLVSLLPKRGAGK
jgi:branched-chain amino acid transport system permease protein